MWRALVLQLFLGIFILKVSNHPQKYQIMLQRLIELSQISGHIDTECAFGGNWQLSVETMDNTAIVHIVTHGEAWLKLQQQQIKIQAGDILFFPRAHAHRLHHALQHTHAGKAESTILTELQTSQFTLKHTAENPDFSMFCAHFRYLPPAELFQHLPDFMHVHLRKAQFDAVIFLLQQEALQAQQGAQKIINALSKILLIYILRAYLEQHAEQLSTGILKSWQSSKLGPLIEQIIQQPALDWSLDHMAASIYVSRIQLIRLFKRELNITPHVFVTQIRLQHAARQLKTSHLSILSIALDLGFQPETHFGQSFKRYYGLKPHQYRLQK